jgi:hypothetical protein
MRLINAMPSVIRWFLAITLLTGGVGIFLLTILVGGWTSPMVIAVAVAISIGHLILQIEILGSWTKRAKAGGDVSNPPWRLAQGIELASVAVSLCLLAIAVTHGFRTAQVVVGFLVVVAVLFLYVFFRAPAIARRRRRNSNSEAR